MSTEIGILKNAGSRNKDVSITRYYGGKEKGTCLQLTQEMEHGSKFHSYGYVQLSVQDLVDLLPIIQKHVIDYDRNDCSDESIPYSENFIISDELKGEV